MMKAIRACSEPLNGACLTGFACGFRLADYNDRRYCSAGHVREQKVIVTFNNLINSSD